MGRWKSTWIGLAFISPWLCGFVLLYAYPFLASLYWSFCEYDLLTAPQFVGVANYQRIVNEFATGTGFGRALWNTAYYALVSVPLSVVVGVLLAIALSWKVRGPGGLSDALLRAYRSPGRRDFDFVDLDAGASRRGH